MDEFQEFDKDKINLFEQEFGQHLDRISRNFSIEIEFLVDIIKHYTGDGFKTMNKILLKGRNDKEEDNYKGPDYMRIVILNYILSTFNLPFDLEVYRGIYYDENSKYLFRSLRSNKEVVLRNFTSTSLYKSTGDFFSMTYGNPSVLFKIILPKGSHCAYIPNIMSVHNEDEIILPIGSKIRLLNKYDNKPNSFINAKLLIGKEYNFTPRMGIVTAIKYYNEYLKIPKDDQRKKEEERIFELTKDLFYI